MRPFFVYLLRCSDASYYTGQTDDLEARLRQHAVGEIGYTATRKPVELVWRGEFETRDAALAFERQVKGWSRLKKEALIAGDWDRMRELAQSKSAPKTELHVAGPSTGSGRTGLLEQGLGVEHFSAEGPSTGSGRTGLLEQGPGVEHFSAEGPSTGSGRTGLLERVLGKELASEQRRAIAKAITLLESTRTDHRQQADGLLTALLPHTGKSLRLGLSGVPGVGKSTFIEALGLYLIDKGHRVAVLAVDPSSTVSGGSILGDKTRMEKLSVHPQAYIRPSPSSGNLGGVAEKTREAMLVCEAAGYDVVIVETVGVGQSEIAVAHMTDMFVLMQLPNAGDDLQAIKKGVMELADLVLINKADIDADAALRAQAQITSSLRLMGFAGDPHAPPSQARWQPQVLQVSALHAQGLDAFWDAVTRFKALQTDNGQMAARRQGQAQAWMWERIDAGLKHAFHANPAVQALLPQLTTAVQSGQLAASTAARQLLAAVSLDVARTRTGHANTQADFTAPAGAGRANF
jgi:LAO/AO transport system kinase